MSQNCKKPERKNGLTIKNIKSSGYLISFLAVLFVSETSEAGDNSGYYVKGEVGYGFPNDPDSTSGAGVASTNESNDDSQKFGIGLGYNRN